MPELIADDRLLLARFIEERDEAAFASIVKRHGKVVLGVCRRVVRSESLAEDAFQAVFLVLARNPRAAASASSIAGWLFGVARRVGLAAARSERRRLSREQRAAALSNPAPAGEWDELLIAVDEELAKLPEENRAALIACFLCEQTQDEAARELGWSLSTLRRRLERGKELLRARLTRRGATLAAGLFAGLLAPSNAAALPPELLAKAGSESSASPAVLALAAPQAVGKFAAGVIGVLLAVVAIGALSPRQLPEAEAAPIAAVPGPAPKPEWVAISGRVVFPADRDIPERREILKTDGIVKDAECCFQDGRRLFHENVIIEPKTRGLANAVVWLRPDSDDAMAVFPADKIRGKHEPAERLIEVKECQFTPRITVARAGDTLRFKNPAPLATNVRYDSSPRGPGAKFTAFNVLLAAKTGDYAHEGALAAGRVADVFQSSIYAWMKGYVWAFEHPYFTVTDAEGRFSIPNAPLGTWRLTMWHEEYGYSGGTIAGTKVNVSGDTRLGSLTFSIRIKK